MNINNQRKIIIKQIKSNLIIILSVIILFITGTITLFNNKTIIKTSKNNNTKALDQEGETYRLVTSADNVQVPVPKGYVASQIEGENYVTPQYQHTINTYKVESTPTELTWSSPAGEQYPWTQDENGIWISGNQGIEGSTSILESEEFYYIKGTTLTMNYTYSSLGGDFLDIDLINLTNNITIRILDYKCGNTSTSFDYLASNYTYTMNNWATGRYKIRAVYSKDYSADAGQDSAYIKPSTYFKEDENGETIEEDIKTKIHDGGFVIYQLTDEETEIDPNGASININDTNKDIAQSTRNQYVWVPVENIEDIVRTKVENNGIMQFGQNYLFRDTSITKETTSILDNCFREPRLVEEKETTRFFLQRFSDIKNRENYLNHMQDNYTRMIKSINKYKGYYIGRYETGDDVSHNNIKRFFINPQIARYKHNLSNVTWYDSYKDLKRLSGKTGEYVEAGMLYDSLLDFTLKWLNDTETRSYEDISKDSGTWINYSNNRFKYKTSANGIESDDSSSIIVYTGGITEITYNGETYNNYPTSSNNIFDIAGNVEKWTMSRKNSNKRRCRGGNWWQR